MARRALYYVRVSAKVVEIFGLVFTAWRICFRFKIGRFWWEDAWAAILLATGIIWVITFWAQHPSGPSAIVGAWIGSIGFTCIVTSARMSVLFSVIRIIHGPPRLLKFTYACVAFFAACWTVLIVARTVLCALDSSWHHIYTSGRPSCPTSAQIAIFQFTSDCVAVLILVVLPLHMLWKVKLPRRKKRMILSIFASSVVLAFAAIFHTVGQFLNNTTVMIAGMHAMASLHSVACRRCLTHFQVALSIIVCNLLVIVTYTYRFLLRDVGSDSTEDANDDDDFTSQVRSMSSLTTVDLDVSFTGPETGVGYVSSQA
ncbi:hypothetical protein JVU11DRAFT_7255 [Chiua virens]|nr:hypothetical protein JVU11DRAFT_7255 [Chiua virens]